MILPVPNTSPNSSPIQTIAIAGGKGGIGKTSVAVNLASALGTAGNEVLLLDGDFEFGNIDQLLDLRSSLNVRDVLQGQCKLDQILTQGPKGVTVIPSPNGCLEMTRLSQLQHAGLIGLFSDLPTAADTLIIDIATGLSTSVLSFCRAVREVIVVLVEGPSALQDAFSTIRLLHDDCHVRRFRVVANKTSSSHQGLDLYDALTRLTDRYLDVLLDFCGSIPLDSQLRQAACQQETVIEAFPRSPSALAFSKLGARVNRWPTPQTPCGHTEFFIERLIQADASTR